MSFFFFTEYQNSINTILVKKKRLYYGDHAYTFLEGITIHHSFRCFKSSQFPMFLYAILRLRIGDGIDFFNFFCVHSFLLFFSSYYKQ